MAVTQRKVQKVEVVAEPKRKPRKDPRRLKAFADRLNAMMSELGVPERGRARVIKDRVGVGGTAAQNWLRGNSYPSFEELGRIGRLGLDPARLLPMKGDVVPANIKGSSTSAAKDSKRLAKLIESQQLLPLMRLHTDDGQWNHTALPNRVWQQLLGREVDGFVLMFMTGDSMGERIKDGTPLLIDTNVTQITGDNGIYALLMGETVMVRRVQRRLQGDYLISCDNPLIAPETITHLGSHQDSSAKAGEVLVLGRVAMAMQKL
jgi:hypothetical protein